MSAAAPGAAATAAGELPESCGKESGNSKQTTAVLVTGLLHTMRAGISAVCAFIWGGAPYVLMAPGGFPRRGLAGYSNER